MNRWNISRELEASVKARDKRCVYCRAVMRQLPRARGVPANKATWEHIDNDGPPSAANIVICCGACNTSKGTKDLLQWLKSEYCTRNKINEKTVSPIIRKWLRNCKSL